MWPVARLPSESSAEVHVVRKLVLRTGVTDPIAQVDQSGGFLNRRPQVRALLGSPFPSRTVIATLPAMGLRSVVSRVAAVLLIGCKDPPPPEPPAAPIVMGHSTTKVANQTSKPAAPPLGDAGVAGDAGVVGDAAPVPLDDGMAPVDAAVAGEAAPRIGGNGSPAYRDASGQVRGPGGPVFMGHGPPCDLAHDHCLRPDVWFSVDNFVAGKLYRALPVFQFEDIWYDWRGREVSPTKLYRTKAAGDSLIRAGTEVIVFSSETASRDRWVDSEHEALTSSRWVAGVTESASKKGMVRIKGLADVSVETVRLITGARRP